MAMKQPLYARYHKSRKSQPYQLLKEHSANVAKIASRRGKMLGLMAVCTLLGWMHDSGKADTNWQVRRLSQNIPGISHSDKSAAAMYALLCDAEKEFGVKFSDLAKQMLCVVVYGHHAGLPDIIDPISHAVVFDYTQMTVLPSDLGYFYQTVCNKKKLMALAVEACAELDTLTGRIKMSCFTRSGTAKNFGQKAAELAVHLGYLASLLLGILVDADYIDAGCWVKGERPNLTGRKPWRYVARRVDTYRAKLNLGGAMDALRSEIYAEAENAGKNAGPGIYRLTAPTGGGKTLSSLAFSAQAALAGNKNRIIYCAPYTNILNQTSYVLMVDARLRKYAIEQYTNMDHSPHFMDERADIPEPLYDDIRAWDAPLVLTSTVRFLNTLFSGQQADTRHLAYLINSVIIIDEVQRISVKNISLFNSYCDFLSDVCGCTILFCTATQPNLNVGTCPLDTTNLPEILGGLQSKFDRASRVNVIDLTSEGKKSNQQIADLVCTCAKKHKSVLCVCNTKNVAFEVYLQAKAKIGKHIPVYHMSAWMTIEDRMRVYKKVTNRLAKGKPTVLISTQVVEAGVDISFHCGIRVAAGLDSLAQTGGRENRHGELVGKAPLYLVLSQAENTYMMTEINNGKQALEAVLQRYYGNPGIYGSDILSPAIMEAYAFIFAAMFSSAYCDYLLTDPSGKAKFVKGDTLFGELSVNSKGTAPTTPPPHLPMRQSFRTGKRHFRPIDTDTLTLLVDPRLVKELEAANAQRVPKRLYEAIQKKSVDVYRSEMAKWVQNGIAIQIGNSGIYKLLGAYYIKGVGLDVTTIKQYKPPSAGLIP